MGQGDRNIARDENGVLFGSTFRDLIMRCQVALVEPRTAAFARIWPPRRLRQLSGSGSRT